MKENTNDLKRAKTLLVPIVKRIARHKDVKAKLAEGKARRKELDRPDFVWHELLLSFATMGNSRGAEGLIRNQHNYRRVTFEALTRKRTNASRLSALREVLRAAKVRMSDKKADWLMENYDRVAALGGPTKAKETLLNTEGREEKIKFWRGFKGIGKKYARNIMMDVYHPDFRNYIAVDERIKKITRALSLTFRTYEPEEQFYLDVAKQAGLQGWELDRMLYNFRDCILDGLEDAEDLVAARKALKEKTIPWEQVKRELNL
jgi:thermostable 8-oxoguanine DNA glycosylase